MLRGILALVLALTGSVAFTVPSHAQVAARRAALVLPRALPTASIAGPEEVKPKFDAIRVSCSLEPLYGHVCAFEVVVWPRCRRVKGRKGCPDSISPTVVCLHVTAHVRGSCLHVTAHVRGSCLHVTAHVRGSCLHVTAHVRGSPTSCDSCPYYRHDQSHALTTQELRDIRNAEATRELIFFWLPAALLSTFTFYYELTTP